jgi:hypothetical protein
MSASDPLTVTGSSAGLQQAALSTDRSAAGPKGAAGRDTLTPTADLAAAEDDDGLSFWDVLDIVNPLQHIPIVSTLYREITGDQIGDAARLAGGALFGGPIGLAAAGVDYAVKALTGDHIEGHVMAMLGFGEPATAKGTAVAEAAEEVTEAAAKAPTPAVMAAEGAAPVAAGPATEETPPTAAAGQNPRVTGKWFPLDGTERRDPFMPLGAQARLDHARKAIAQKTAPAATTSPEAQAGAPSTEAQAGAPSTEATTDGLRRAGTVEVRPQGTPAAGMLPLGLLQGVETSALDGSAAAAAPPPPAALRQAMKAQGLTPRDSSALASGTEGVDGAGQAAGTGDTGPIQVPGWFDTAMQKALSAYEKTGRLGTPG